ncbi:MAG: sigma-70 family RNA polymerase sigma factor [Actinomycetota bacterium]
MAPGRSATGGSALAEPLDTASDAELAAAFVAGSEAAFGALYRRFARPIFDFLRWTVRSPDAAEDLVQATFLSAYERRESLREPAAIRGWLYRIAHNLAMNQVTRTPQTDELAEDAPVPADAPGPADLAASAEAAALVWDAAASLEPRQYAVLDLSVRKGLTTTEIGHVLELDAAAASLAVFRAREALGNAVRFLLVARRRKHCERLAELVPAGVRRLTPAQRATVDRHLRRCADCQRAAVLLTAPEELFGLAPLAALPPGLRTSPRFGRAAGGRSARAVRRLQFLRTPLGLGAIAVVAAASTVIAISTTHKGSGDGANRSRQEATAGAATGSPRTATTGSTANRFAALATTGFRAVDPSRLPAGAVFHGAACPSSRRCYAVAESPAAGVVTITTDSGRSWTGSTVPESANLRAIACTTETACVVGGTAALGQTAVMLSTSDGGASWKSASVPADAIIGTIRCPDQTHCLAVGEDQRKRVPSVLSSTDGGRTWLRRAAPSTSGYAGYLGGARCLDAAHCWVVGSGIWFTADLGQSFRDLTPSTPACKQQICGGPSHTLTDVEFMTPTDGWIIGGVPCGGYGVTQCPSYLAHTSDAGKSWRPASDADANRYPFAMQIQCAASTCLVVGQTLAESVVTLTTNAGSDWRATQQVASFVNALACSPDRSLCVLAGGKAKEGALFTLSGP